MDKLKKLLRKITESDRVRLLAVLKLVRQRQFDLLDTKKMKGYNLYRVRTGKFRIIFYLDRDKKVVISAVKIRDEKTYKL